MSKSPGDKIKSADWNTLSAAVGGTGAPATSTYITQTDETADLANSTQHRNLTGADLHNPKTHESSHVSGGSDPFLSTDELACEARVGVRKTGVAIGSRRHLNFVAGTGTSWTITDDSGDEEVEIACNASSGATVTCGTASLSGDDSTVAFTIAHGFGSAPTCAHISPTTKDAAGDFYLALDATNITITYKVAPVTGTNNLGYYWTVVK